MSWFKDIKKELVKSNPINIYVRGTQWNLASNAIHFIDLVCFFTDEHIRSIDSSGLKTWKPSKRKGYFEVFGNLKINYNKGSLLNLNSRERGTKNLLIKINNSNKKVVLINDLNGIAITSERKKIKGSLEYLSNQFVKVFDDIISFNNCELPTLEGSINQHKYYLEAMLLNWNKINISKDKILPIT